MTRKIRRTRSFDLTLDVTDAAFLKLPRESQRGWVLNRVVREAAEELDHMNGVSDQFVAGADGTGLLQDRRQAELNDDEIMEDWQIPIMQHMAGLVTASGGDVLEIGFGRGVGSEFIQQGKPGSHTIIECNDSVVRRFEQWRAGQTGDIRLIHALWQDALPDLGAFDGIFFHTYPLDEEEYVEQVAQASTFAEHFFEHASAHLKPDGVFTYLTMEADSLSRAHQRALLRHFGSVSMSMVEGLQIPQQTRDSHFLNRMLVVAATT